MAALLMYVDVEFWRRPSWRWLRRIRCFCDPPRGRVHTRDFEGRKLYDTRDPASKTSRVYGLLHIRDVCVLWSELDYVLDYIFYVRPLSCTKAKEGGQGCLRCTCPAWRYLWSGAINGLGINGRNNNTYGAGTEDLEGAFTPHCPVSN
jgi:hypothetical protein